MKRLQKEGEEKTKIYIIKHMKEMIYCILKMIIMIKKTIKSFKPKNNMTYSNKSININIHYNFFWRNLK